MPDGDLRNPEYVEIVAQARFAEAEFSSLQAERACAATQLSNYTKDGRICTTGLRHGGGDFIPDDWFDNDMTPAVRARIDQSMKESVQFLDDLKVLTMRGVEPRASSRLGLKELVASYGLTLGLKDIELLLALNASARDLVLEIKASYPSDNLAAIIAELDAVGGL